MITPKTAAYGAVPRQGSILMTGAEELIELVSHLLILQERRVAQTLISHGQQHLFRSWPKAGTRTSSTVSSPVGFNWLCKTGRIAGGLSATRL